MENMANENMLNQDAWRRFKRIARPFWVGDQKWVGYRLIGLVILLMFVSSAFTVFAFSTTGDATSALQREDFRAMWTAIAKCAVALGLASFATSFFEAYRTNLALTWRLWHFKHDTDKLFKDDLYYRMIGDPRVENPGQRLTQTLESWVNSAVGLSLSATNALVDISLFLVQLCLITWVLGFAVAVYSALGSFIAYKIGKKLIQLNLDQRKNDAALREYLDDINRDAESIAVANGGSIEKAGANTAIDRLISTLRQMMYVNRRLSFFSTPYGLLMPLIPTMVIAPFYVHSAMQIGVVVTAGTAFAKVFRGMNVFVDQFNGISSFVSDTHRLGILEEVMEELQNKRPQGCEIDTIASDHVEAKQLSVLTIDAKRLLVDKANFAIKTGSRTLLMGASGCGKSTLLHALIGLPVPGSGSLWTPPRQEITVLPQRPFFPEVTLRQALTYPRQEIQVSDVELLSVLQRVGLADLVTGVGGLDTVQKWTGLSLRQQQLMSFARFFLAPSKFVILDEATSALDPIAERMLHNQLSKLGLTLISAGHRPALVEYSDTIIEFKPDGVLLEYPSDKFDLEKWSQTHESEG